MKHNIRIGSHVSTKGGFLAAAHRAAAIGSSAYQYFPKNPRGLQLKNPDINDAAACAAYCREHGIASIAHTPYPTNMAVGLTRGKELYTLTVESLKNDLLIAEACGSLGIVVHFGYLKSEDILSGYQNVIHCMNDVLQDWHGVAKLLIENQAGDHGSMGMTLEECAKVRQLADFPEKIGFCLDTCHLFAAGGWNVARTDELLARGRSLAYWDALEAVHLNDSKYGAGSRKDRHARIGQGMIGMEALKSLVLSAELRNKIFVLESEKGDDGTHREDVATVQSWS
ncbi:deoxyribonuclease IV [Paenibacillus sp. JCM 10914]|uniref:deoxyribonuclease IV n=1 Tax=Paenibacillus sp. JCM 10914 TaxID=1236974 RepID=UPI0003CC9EB4|nr:deoxyribonuclease IV [Paenibacillus sp. JCM 10914]GAE05358.1 endonuclease IV [Paenibacillus sp. JCM 10914]